MHLTTVLFDLDGTLLDRRATFRLHLEGQIRRHPAVFEPASSDGYLERLLVLDEQGALDRAEFYRVVQADLGLPRHASDLLREDFERHFPERCIPQPNVTECLDALRERGMKLGLVTNGGAVIQGRKIDRSGLRSRFGSIVISESAGVRKPDPKIFELCLRELGEPSSAAVYVGDNPEPDVGGAKAAGLYAVWRRDPFWPEPELADEIIDDLMELLPWIDARVESDPGRAMRDP
jgi:putative hydrolase of the HAD superfamily